MRTTNVKRSFEIKNSLFGKGESPPLNRLLSDNRYEDIITTTKVSIKSSSYNQGLENNEYNCEISKILGMSQINTPKIYTQTPSEDTPKFRNSLSGILSKGNSNKILPRITPQYTVYTFKGNKSKKNTIKSIEQSQVNLSGNKMELNILKLKELNDKSTSKRVKEKPPTNLFLPKIEKKETTTEQVKVVRRSQSFLKRLCCMG